MPNAADHLSKAIEYANLAEQMQNLELRPSLLRLARAFIDIALSQGLPPDQAEPVLSRIQAMETQ